MEFILEYLGIIGIGLTILVVYNRYKSGWFSKKETNEEGQDDEQQSRFQKWWTQSYIREIYRVRASQRKLICFIPWVGMWVSVFFVNWYLVGVYDSLMHPYQPFEKLTRYDGVVKKYVYHRKGSDILTVELLSGERKNFHLVLRKKEIMDTWLDKNITIWTQKEWGILDGNYEWTQVVDLDGTTVLGNKTYDRALSNQQYVDEQSSNLLLSTKWLLGFLVLLWFINMNPVETTENKNQ